MNKSPESDKYGSVSDPDSLSLDPNPIRIQGFDGQKFKKN